MDKHLKIAVLGLFGLVAPACGGSGGYDGPGKDLVGDWDTDLSLDFVLDGFEGSQGGFGLVSITADGDGLLIEDDACAYPATGDGDDRLTFVPDDGCVRDPLGDPVRFQVTAGTGSLNGSFITLELSGTLAPLDGSAGGTFTLVHRGERAAGGGGSGGGGGDGLPGPGDSG